MDVSHFWGVDWLDKDTNQWESEFCSIWVLWFSCSQFCTSALCINLAALNLVKYIGVYRLSHPVGLHVLSEWCSRTQLVREDPNNLHIETHTACQEARDGVSFSFWFFFFCWFCVISSSPVVERRGSDPRCTVSTDSLLLKIHLWIVEPNTWSRCLR